MNEILIDVENLDDEDPDEEKIRSFVSDVLAHLKRDGWELSLVLCGDEFIRELNREYRGKDEATDVLSFPQVDSPGEIPEKGPFLAGDIVISVPYTKENAKNFSVSVEEEFKRLVIHGILHLSALDHETNDLSEPMLLEQESILSHFKEELGFKL